MDYLTNLLLNMLSGLRPEELTEYDVQLLRERFGENWFEELGYSEPQYRRPVFDEPKNKSKELVK
jgi:hypothetical protein